MSHSTAMGCWSLYKVTFIENGSFRRVNNYLLTHINCIFMQISRQNGKWHVNTKHVNPHHTYLSELYCVNNINDFWFSHFRFVNICFEFDAINTYSWMSIYIWEMNKWQIAKLLWCHEHILKWQSHFFCTLMDFHNAKLLICHNNHFFK